MFRDPRALARPLRRPHVAPQCNRLGNGMSTIRSRQAVPGVRELPFERVALLLQGGGALGSYQAGAYEALHEHGIEPNWIAGISIGANNSAVGAGNSRAARTDERRVGKDGARTGRIRR